MTFAKGQSGNPAGRQPGSRNKATLVMDELIAGDAEEITKKLIREAKFGDLPATRMLLDRLYPKRRDAPVRFDMPRIASLADVPAACVAICEGVASGELSVSEADTLSRTVERMAATLRPADAEARLARIEAVLAALAAGGIKVEALASATNLQAEALPGGQGTAMLDGRTRRVGVPAPAKAALASATNLQAKALPGGQGSAMVKGRTGRVGVSAPTKAALASATNLQAKALPGGKGGAIPEARMERGGVPPPGEPGLASASDLQAPGGA